ncbi:hypothetical protein DHODJN_25350 [Methylorubrum extorquens]
MCSPQSNGISETFVKTLERGDARLTILPGAETVMRLLPIWFEGYNTIHLHFGLRMLSPREFLSRSAQTPAAYLVRHGALQSTRRSSRRG